VIAAIEVKHLSPKDMYWYKEEAIWEETKSEERTKGHQEGLKEGLKEGLRRAILDMCDLLGLHLEEAQHAQLEALDAEGLGRLRERIKAEKRWPVGMDG